MADDWKCPFCGSKTIMKKTNAVKGFSGEPIMTYCCKAQKVNADYAKKYDPASKPTPDEVANVKS